MSYERRCLSAFYNFARLLLVRCGGSSRVCTERGWGFFLRNAIAVIEEGQFDEFYIRSFRSDDLHGCLEILRRAETSSVLRGSGSFHIGNSFDPERGANLQLPVGTDITGLGKPNVIVAEWTGGGHCCYVFHVIELGTSTVREVADIDLADASLSHFVDLDGDGVYEIESSDFTFAYWHSSFAASAAPRVVLRFNGRNYEAAPSLMRRPAPDPTEIDKVVHQIRGAASPGQYLPVLLWRTMLDLIYTGHSDDAWKLVAQAWRGTASQRESFMADFCGQLANSAYFEALRPMRKEAPCAFDPKRGQRM